MKKLFEKHETLFCLALIALYIAVNSFCMQNFGIASLASAVVNTIFSAGLLAFTLAFGRASHYGLKKAEDPKKYLYFLPLALIVSVNLWSGVHINHTPSQILFHILTMLNVGFLEELIFRGYLFRMMAKDNVKAAIAVSSLTFGFGHIVNLFNGAELVPTLLQICYATAIGYLFVIIFHKSGTLLPCIVAHSLNNALSVFHEENAISRFVVPIFLIVFPILYALLIQRKEKSL